MKNVLTQIAIKNAGDGRIHDGGGLILDKKAATGKWTYRYTYLGKRREMGLGSWPTVTLAAARSARDGWAADLAAGNDPIRSRDAQRAAETADRDKRDPTFAELVTLVFDAKRNALRGDGSRGRWRSPLDTHVLPKIGRTRVSELTAADIADTLRPIWRKKHPTAIKAWRRIRICLSDGQLMGFDANPILADQAQRILGTVLHVEQPIESTPWQKLPALYARLPDTTAGDCLRFMILTIVRQDGCRGATISEFDGDVWTVPADRIKGREGKVRDFRVPLSPEAQRVVTRAAAFADGPLFATRSKKPISATALEKALNVLGEPGRPHGFRASFRTWVQDTDACGWDVSETVLGHTIGNKVERTYARSDLLERRRIVMAAWARHVTGSGKSATVYQLK